VAAQRPVHEQAAPRTVSVEAEQPDFLRAPCIVRTIDDLGAEESGRKKAFAHLVDGHPDEVCPIPIILASLAWLLKTEDRKNRVVHQHGYRCRCCATWDRDISFSEDVKLYRAIGFSVVNLIRLRH